MIDCTVRIATPNDARDLAAMHVASWRETYTGILPDKMLSSLSIEARAAAWTKIMQEPATERATTIYLAEHGMAIIGFGSCGPQRTENLCALGYAGEFRAIYLLQAFQGRGIGARLLKQMTAGLRGRGYSAAALWVLGKNQIARRFYEHHGGQVVAEREETREDTVLVELAYGWSNLTELCK